MTVPIVLLVAMAALQAPRVNIGISRSLNMGGSWVQKLLTAGCRRSGGEVVE
jgi:hypothetical protein